MRAGALITVVGACSVILVLAGSGQRTRPAEVDRTGTTLHVPAGGDLQGTLNAAVPGDTITLAAGATYTGPFRLPRHDGDGWIEIRAAASPLGALPPAGTRVSPSHAPLMPMLVAASGSVIVADAGAHHYRFVGLRIAPMPGVFLTNLVDLGGDARTLESMPHDFDFQRCYLHGDPIVGTRRGVAMNSARTSVYDSYFADFKQVGQDAQALAAWNGTGPFTIVNNYLEGAGENVMFGGADPAIHGLVPSDITIARNTFSKPLSWQQGHPTYAGTPWTVKNLLELKNARRVVIRGNIFEFNWPAAQKGFAVLFTVRNQDGGAPWSVVEDVEFSSNVVRHVAAGLNILGTDDIFTSQQTRRVLVRNNLFYDVGGIWGHGRLIQVLNGTADVVIEHNTGDHAEAAVFAGDSQPHTGFVFRNNIVAGNDYGVIGSGVRAGWSTLSRYFPDAVFHHNVIAGSRASDYPADNLFPASSADVMWVDRDNGNYRLADSSPFKGTASDGRDPGIDAEVLWAEVTGSGSRAIPRRSVLSLVAITLFWGSFVLVAYTYAGYGVLTWLWATLRPRPIRREPIRPTVSVVVIAHNEAARIQRRIANLLAGDYPSDRLDVVVVSDGSTDDSVRRARSVECVQVVACANRRGKASVLNDVVPGLRGDIVVFADARQSFDPHAITALVEPFADPGVGAVSGELMIVPRASDHAGAGGVGLYWRCEKLLRRWESRIDSTVGATGAVYAIRRKLFEPLAEDTLLDDVVIPLRIVRAGHRVVFEPGARAYDYATGAPGEEFGRKARTIAGTFQLFARERWIWSPRHNRLWVQTLSHKGLRLILPCAHLLLFVANLALIAEPSYRWVMGAQVMFYLSAVAAHAWPSGRRRIRALSAPYTICFLSWATVVGFARFVTGRQRVTWDRPPLTSPSS